MKTLKNSMKERSDKLLFFHDEVEYWSKRVRLIHNKKVQHWCGLPYPRHKNGCPKYMTPDCSPNALYITEILDLKKPCYFVFQSFDLEAHAKKMARDRKRKGKPPWTRAQLRNVLYWQNTNRRKLLEKARIVGAMLGADTIITKPEAHGVNVYATCMKIGVKLEKIKDLKVCRHIAIVGWRKREQEAEKKKAETS